MVILSLEPRFSFIGEKESPVDSVRICAKIPRNRGNSDFPCTECKLFVTPLLVSPLWLFTMLTAAGVCLQPTSTTSDLARPIAGLKPKVQEIRTRI